MNASEEEKCRRCGVAIPAKSTDEICPACLLSGALADSDDRTETLSMVPGHSPSFAGPSKFPSELGGYRLLRLLGRGGMGTVYEAEQLATGRRLALKTLGHQLGSPEMRQRFLREGRLAARVNHPNSLYVFGSEEIDGLPVITMEIAGAGTLKDRLKKVGPLPVAEAVDATLDVISGLESAVAHGVLHRDIKPSNCFVCPDGSVKVGDFGLSVSTLAKTDTFVTAHGKIMGTPAYASPEQLRGDPLDLRADIYSVGATLFTLLTDRAPFEGDNAVQVVANAVNQKPLPLMELRDGLPPRLERVVMRCLAKEPDGRFADYAALRDALLPFSSKEPEPASLSVRASAGWIDYLIALLPPYVVMMFVVGSEKLLVAPLVERTLYSARYYFLLFGLAFLYFGIFEGTRGAGLGKRLKGLRVVRPNGRPPGFWRALIRIVIPIVCVEGVRMPVSMAFISTPEWTGLQTAMFVIVASLCGWIPVFLVLRARRENRFETMWDRASGTRVVLKPKATVRQAIEPAVHREFPDDTTGSLGPYRVTGAMAPGEWLVGNDPVLRRRVWLLRQGTEQLSRARRDVARPGRLRWLQSVRTAEADWNAFEATQGIPFRLLCEGDEGVPWRTLRYLLHDLTSELWAAAADRTLPSELSLDHVWVTAEGRAVVLDEPWPAAETPAERFPVGNLAGQQRFMSAVAGCVESTSLPVHARRVLRNLEDGKFEKLSFLTGVLQGLLDKPAEVTKAIRAGSIFMLPLYVWIAAFVGRYHDKPMAQFLDEIVIVTLLVLGAVAALQFLALPFRSTASHSIFRMAVVNARGEPAGPSHLLARWAIVWLPLFLPMAVAGALAGRATGIPSMLALALFALWGGAVCYAVVQPHRGLHDRLAGTWVVRR